jgi:hypothetical protein
MNRSVTTMVGLVRRSALAAVVVLSAAVVVLSAGCGTVVSPQAQAQSSPTASPTPTPTRTATPAPTTAPSATPSPTSAGALGSLTGAWKGTWINATPKTATGTFTLTWAQQGSLVVGAIGVSGSDCLSAGNVSGTVEGDKVSFGAVEGNTTITYVGTVSGTTMSGTYTTACGNSSGTWQAIKA